MSEAPLRSRPLVGRRSVLRLLGVAALGVVAGCRSGTQRAAPAGPGTATTSPIHSPQPGATSTLPSTTSSSPKPAASALSPEQLDAQRIAAAEQDLLAAYDAITVAHPELAGRLATFRADHVAHLQALVPGATPSGPPPSTTPASTASASTSPSSTSPSSTASAGPPLSSPPASSAILHQLADLERAAAAARLSDVATTSGSLARLIASIGGCEAAHAALLSVAT